MKPSFFSLLVLFFAFGILLSCQDSTQVNPSNSSSNSEESFGEGMKGPPPGFWVCTDNANQSVVFNLNTEAENYSYDNPSGICEAPVTVTSTFQLKFNFQNPDSAGMCNTCAVNLAPFTSSSSSDPWLDVFEYALTKARENISCSGGRNLFITEISNFRFTSASSFCDCNTSCGDPPGYDMYVEYDITYQCCGTEES